MKHDLAQVIGRIIASAQEDLSTLSQVEVSTKPSPDKWSKQQILGHLIDSGLNNHRRFKQSAQQSHLVFDGYNQDEEVLAHKYQNREWQKIVSLWAGINDQILHLLLSFDDELFSASTIQHNFDRIGFKSVPSSSESTLGFLVLDYISHLEHHLSQIIPGYNRLLLSYENDPLAYTLSEN